MKNRALTYAQECELYELLELRRTLANKKLMARFRVGYSVIQRVMNRGPSVPRESIKKSLIDECLKELRP